MSKKCSRMRSECEDLAAAVGGFVRRPWSSYAYLNSFTEFNLHDIFNDSVERWLEKIRTHEGLDLRFDKIDIMDMPGLPAFIDRLSALIRQQHAVFCLSL